MNRGAGGEGAEPASAASAGVGTKLQLRPDERSERPMRFAKPRLPREDYMGQRIYHITLATTQRAPIFEDVDVGRGFEVALRGCAESLRFRLLAYCFMPDHLHVVLEGEDSSSDLLKFVQRSKQVTGFQFKAISGDRPWQQSFFDRVLRKDEDSHVVARYVFDNPVVGGLPLESPAFLLRGGILFDGMPADGAKASSLHLDSRGSSYDDAPPYGGPR